MKTVLIIGARTGIGLALADSFKEQYRVIGTSRHWPNDLSQNTLKIDVCDEDSIQQAVQKCQDADTQIDAIINCAGMLHDSNQGPEKSTHNLNPEFALRVYQTNAMGHLLVLKHFKPLVIRTAKPLIASVSARVGSIADNRLGGWYSYRMSKSALNMGMKSIDIEWRRSNPSCTTLLLHPGTTDTALSKPFQSRLPPGQLQSTLETAHKLRHIINHEWHDAKQSGIRFIDHNHKPVPW